MPYSSQPFLDATFYYLHKWITNSYSVTDAGALNIGPVGGWNMFTAENCPYIVIGVPAYAPKSEASVGFALATRRAKSLTESPFEVQDLTSALSRIESGETGNQLTYAIPADFELFLRPAPQLSSSERNLTSADLLDLVEQPLSESDGERVALLLLRTGLDQLLQWNWNLADTLFKACLRISKDERTRDEALNLVAACLVMNNDMDRAIQALSKAVEGQWNLRLQANLAILALEVDPKRAIDQMSFLVDGAVGAEEKLAAIKMAIGLWRQVQQEELGTTDDEEFDPLPDRLLKSFVDTLMSPDISEEDFFDLGIFLARVAPASVTQDSLNRTKFCGKASAEIVFARSCDFSHYADSVVRLAYQDNNRAPCVDAHVDGLVEELCQGLFDNQTNLAGVAFSFLEQGLGVETMHRVWVRAALILALPSVLDEGVSPNEQFISWLRVAKSSYSKLPIPEELMQLTTEMMNDASDLLMRLQLRDFFELAGDVEQAANRISQQMTGFFNRLGADKNAIRETAVAGLNWCNAQLAMFAEFEALGLSDYELRKEVNELRSATHQLKQVFQRHL